MAKVAVLLSVHNAGLMLGQAVQSILLQSMSDLTLEIICDRSSEDTIEIAHLFKALDKRVNVHTAKESGPFAGRNAVSAMVDCKFLAIMDADDIALPHRLERQAVILDENPGISAVGAQIINFGERNGAPRMAWTIEDCAKAIGIFNPVCHPTLVCRAASFVAVGGYATRSVVGMDFDIIAKLAQIGGVMNVSDPLLLYRIHDRQITAQNTSEQTAATFSILSHYYSPLRQILPKELAKLMALRAFSLPVRLQRQAWRSIKRVYNYRNQ